jgi:hypothetical protein
MAISVFQKSSFELLDEIEKKHPEWTRGQQNAYLSGYLDGAQDCAAKESWVKEQQIQRLEEELKNGKSKTE